MKENEQPKSNDIIKTKRDLKVFFDAIFNPKPPNDALKKAYESYKKSIDNKKIDNKDDLHSKVIHFNEQEKRLIEMMQDDEKDGLYTRKLTDKERYDIWFRNNYETGMEYYFDPNNLPNFDDPYYTPTPIEITLDDILIYKQSKP